MSITYFKTFKNVQDSKNIESHVEPHNSKNVESEYSQIMITVTVNDLGE